MVAGGALLAWPAPVWGCEMASEMWQAPQDHAGKRGCGD
jgi:hypothetical protein